ncbi:hypothetical protein ACIRD3_29840 [Kitasatospora sp. NPDC093550]|uniref:hypothetical protein n=1 Tax=Kitasatospora sp. NPDC093550 TaxID=3364089 RepID=UPI00382F9FB6
MKSWIDLHALWKIIVVGLLAGAGLPALFAIGVRALVPPSGTGPAGTGPTETGPAGTGPAGTGPVGAAHPGVGGYAVAVMCFAVVLAAIGWGIFVIVDHS